MEIQRQKMAQRLKEIQSLYETQVDVSDVSTPDPKKRSFVLPESYSMEVQRQSLARKFGSSSSTSSSTLSTTKSAIATEDIEPLTTVTVAESLSELVSGSDVDVVADSPLDADTLATISDAEVIVKADFVAPLATTQAPVPNLYRLGFELQAEAKKTAAEMEAAKLLERKVRELHQQQQIRLQNLEKTSQGILRSSLQNQTMLTNDEGEDEDDNDDDDHEDDEAEEEDTSPSVDEPVSLTTMDIDKDLKDAAEKLATAAQESKSRLSALERAKAALLEMQAEVDELERLVREAKAKNKRNTNGTD